jgi:hypothetical protein
MCTNSQALYYSHDYPLNMTSPSGFDGFLASSEFEAKDNEGGLGVYMYLYDTTNDVAVPLDTVR